MKFEDDFNAIADDVVSQTKVRHLQNLVAYASLYSEESHLTAIKFIPDSQPSLKGVPLAYVSHTKKVIMITYNHISSYLENPVQFKLKTNYNLLFTSKISLTDKQRKKRINTLTLLTQYGSSKRFSELVSSFVFVEIFIKDLINGICTIRSRDNTDDRLLHYLQILYRFRKILEQNHIDLKTLNLNMEPVLYNIWTYACQSLFNIIHSCTEFTFHQSHETIEQLFEGINLSQIRDKS